MALIDPSYAVEDGYLTVACCGSCHEDQDYGYWMCEIDVNGETVEVCCAVSVEWGKRD